MRPPRFQPFVTESLTRCCRTLRTLAFFAFKRVRTFQHSGFALGLHRGFMPWRSSSLCLFISISISISIFLIQRPIARTSSVSAFDLAPLEFSNRADCAAKSQSPSGSFFVFADAKNFGRSLHRLSALVGEPMVPFLPRGIQTYHATLAQISKLIIERLISGELPLLDSNAEPLSSHLRMCRKGDCTHLHSHLKAAWLSQSQLGVPSGPLAGAGNGYHSQVSSGSPGSGANTNRGQGSRVVCLRPKFDNPLFRSVGYHQMGKEYVHQLARGLARESEFQDCLSSVPFQSQSAILFQIEPLPKNWDEIGFDIHQSFRLFLSWAWRESSEVADLARPYAELLQSTRVEHDTFLFSQNCKSLAPPQCDATSLSADLLGHLGSEFGRKNLVNREVPLDPSELLMSLAQTGVQTGLRSNTVLSKRPNSTWEESLAAHFSDVQRYRSGIYQALHTSLFRAEAIFKRFSSFFSLEAELDAYLQRSRADSKALSELHFMCLENRLTSDPNGNWFRSRLEQAMATSPLDGYNDLTRRPTSEYFRLFVEHADRVRSFCDRVSNSWVQNSNRGPEWNPGQIRNWAREILPMLPSNSEHAESFVQNLASQRTTATPLQGSGAGAGLWSSSNFATDPIEPGLDSQTAIFIGGPPALTASRICANLADCWRDYTETVVQLYGLGVYASGVLPQFEAKPTEVNSPMGSQVACDIYDPWFAKNRARLLLVHDLLIGGASMVAGLPVFLAGEIKPGEVVSLKSLVEDGRIQYEPQTTSPSYTPFGFVNFAGFGLPCHVSFTETDVRPLKGRFFARVSGEICASDEKKILESSGARDFENPQQSDFHLCGGCTLELTSEEVLFTSVFFLAQGGLDYVPIVGPILRFLRRMKHPDDIPRSKWLRPGDVVQAVKDHGENLPNWCLERLSQGLPCIPDSCAAFAKRDFESRNRIRVQSATADSSSSSNQKLIWMRVQGCEKGHVVYRMNCSGDEPSVQERWVSGACPVEL